MSPRVNSTIKVSLILSKIIQLFKEKDKATKEYVIGQNNRERVFKRILDESSFILKKNSLNEYAQVESLYLLTLLRDLGKEYRLPEEILIKFLSRELVLLNSDPYRLWKNFMFLFLKYLVEKDILSARYIIFLEQSW